MSAPHAFDRNPTDADAIDVAQRLNQLPGIHHVVGEQVVLNDGPKHIYWLSGPASLDVARHPPDWVGPNAHLVATTQTPSDTEPNALPLWTPSALSQACEALVQQNGTQDVAITLTRPIGTRISLGPIYADNALETPDEHTPVPSVIGQSRSNQPAISDGGPLVWPNDLPATCTEAIQRAATSTGEVVIYLPDGQVKRIGYPKLFQQAQCVLAGLQHAGLQPTDTLLIASNDAEVLITGLWAAILGGLYASAIELPDAQADHTAYQRLQAVSQVLDGPILLIDDASAAQRAHIPAFSAQCVVTIKALLKTQASQARIYTAQPDDIALIIMTSGSTGVPKGVMQSHRALLSMVAGVQRQRCAATTNDVFLNWMPRDHIGGLAFVVLGATALCANQVHADIGYILGKPERWLALVDACRVSITWSPNFVYELLGRAARATSRTYDLSSLRHIFNGGEAVNELALLKCVNELARHGMRASTMVPTFGMSETCAAISCGHLGSTIGAFSSLGPAVPGAKIRVVDDDNQALTEGEIGQIQICSPQLLTRYFGLPPDSARVNGSEWFDCGDAGFIADGQLYLTGRLKDTLNVRGVTVFAHELENTLAKVSGVDPTCLSVVPVRPPGASTEEIAVFFSTYPESGLDTPPVVSAVIGAMRDALRLTHAISADHFVPLKSADFPRTPIGKIVKRELREQFEAGHFNTTLARLQALAAAQQHRVALHRQVWAPVHDHRQTLPVTAYVIVAPDTAQNNPLQHLLGAFAAATQKLLVIDLRPRLQDSALRKGSTYDLLQAFAHAIREDDTPEGNGPWHIRIVATKSVFSGPEDAIDDEAATLSGLVGSFNLAKDPVIWSLVDLPPIAQAETALSAPSHFEPLLAWRQGQFLAPRLNPITELPPKRPPSESELWLVAGGLGGVGEQCCLALQSLGASLIVTGTTPATQLSAEKQQRLDRLSQGGWVRYTHVSDAQALSNEVNEAERLSGTVLQGAVHAAGVDLSGDEHWDDAQFQTGLDATTGTLNALNALACDKAKLKLLVVSSVAGVNGARIKSYAAQQAAFIAQAQAGRSAGPAPTVVAFSAWDDTGLSRARTNAALLANDGLLPVQPTAGRAIIQWALSAPGGVICAGLDDQHPQNAWRTIRPATPMLEPSAWAPHAGAVCLPDAHEAARWMPVYSTKGAPRTSEGLLDLARLGQSTLQTKATTNDPAAPCIASFIAAAIDIGTPSVDDDFFLVGGDSVKATQLAAQLSEWFFTEIPVAAIFQHPTPNALAHYLRKQTTDLELFDTVIAHLSQVIDGVEPPPDALAP
ncbi:hypothetical protein PuT2_10035 [Pusillimonas sp. T2]|uniref:AMP-binding protein n=1 Tax=Pusillimonas sp. T2 TaxID=1548123 RepID=UPI000B9D3BE6|nr:AMP-binding protein [Pusillimonas sp. T2]OXR48915.1 hypothetical protein PuT2_10035 [Pusillimonas sp. T2]